MAIRPIEILNTLLTTTANTITISSVDSLGSSLYKINTRNTLYLRTDKKVTINSVEYRITDFEINSYITVKALSGDVPVVVTSFTVDAPLFVWGNPKMVSNELDLRIKNKAQVHPFIWAVEISNTQLDLNPASAIKSTPSFNLFFLDSNKFDDWTISEHYELDIYPLLNYIDFFVAILRSRRDLFDVDSIKYTTTNHVNFGTYTSNQGMVDRILNDDLTGIQVQIDLPIYGSDCDC